MEKFDESQKMFREHREKSRMEEVRWCRYWQIIEGDILIEKWVTSQVTKAYLVEIYTNGDGFSIYESQ